VSFRHADRQIAGTEQPSFEDFLRVEFQAKRFACGLLAWGQSNMARVLPVSNVV
jgi:hypothetical protein